MRRRQLRGNAVVRALASVLVALAGTTGAAAPAAAQGTHVLTVVGLGGDPDYRAAFLDVGLRIRAAALDRFRLPPRDVRLLAEDPTANPDIDGRSDREGVEAAVAEIMSSAGPRDRVLVVLIGHGSFRNDEARFNLPGPDLTSLEWAALLDRFGDRPVALVNAASASGAFLPTLASPTRTVITATKTGRERNETQFATYFAEAMEGDGADLDKDGMLSLLEAFTYTKAEVARWYEESNLLLTEHALLDDNGDGEGSEEPSRDGPDGAAAAFFRLVPATMTATPTEVLGDSVMVRLMNERTELEMQVARLRAIRETLDPEEYDARLEELLIQVALKNREIQARGGGGG